MSELDQARMEQGREITRTVVCHLRFSDVLRAAYPAMFEGGVARGSFHSFMLSALLLLGDQLGYSAVADCPLFDPLDKLLVGEGAKRPDSIWFERGTEKVRALFEFEGYDARSLEEKAHNLTLMANACQEDLRLLVLMYWSREPRASKELSSATDLFKRGFRANGGQYGPVACPVLILETLTQARDDCVTISSFVARQFVFGREEKPYVVEELNQLHAIPY